MAEKEEGQRRSPGPLWRKLLDLASHPRIPQGASLVTISIVVGLIILSSVTAAIVSRSMLGNFVMASVPVRDALTHRLLWVPEEMTVEGFLQRSAEEQHEWFPVLNQSEELIGVVTAQDVQKALGNGDLQATVGELATKDLVTVTPDNTLQDVLVRFHGRDLGHLPVVNPDSPKKLVGIVSRLPVIRAYNRALINKHLL